MRIGDFRFGRYGATPTSGPLNAHQALWFGDVQRGPYDDAGAGVYLADMVYTEVSGKWQVAGGGWQGARGK